MTATELTPSLLDTLRSEYDVIPVVRAISADTVTPVAAFAALAGWNQEAFLLESVERGESAGRYSFIGVEPRRTRAFRHGMEGCAAALREELVPLKVWNQETLPPFFGGAVGWFGYGVAGWTERLPDRHAATGEVDAELLFFDQIAAFDHLRQKLYLCANIFSDEAATSDELLSRARGRILSMISKLEIARTDLTPFDREAPVELEPQTSREEFLGMVAAAKEQIAAGEIFQAVLSQRWVARYPTVEALTLYRALRSVNPSPYMFLLRTRERTLVGASPEMLVRVEGGRVETRPIAGTRPRGTTRGEDEALAAQLLADEKENAEHLMLVDLGRNDVGRVAAPGSVRVEQFRGVERYSHVMHLVSSVTADLRDGASAVDAFLSTFPAGTVSGAPKIRAMEIIDGLEPLRRNVYGGAVLYAGFSGNLDSCIAIRTIVLESNRASIQAGAGIVWDSVPELEHQECVNKAAALGRALRLAAGVLSSTAEDAAPRIPVRSQPGVTR